MSLSFDLPRTSKSYQKPCLAVSVRAPLACPVSPLMSSAQAPPCAAASQLVRLILVTSIRERFHYNVHSVSTYIYIRVYVYINKNPKYTKHPNLQKIQKLQKSNYTNYTFYKITN